MGLFSVVDLCNPTLCDCSALSNLNPLLASQDTNVLYGDAALGIKIQPLQTCGFKCI